ncbi:hypothetical protein EDC01DRAFT_634144 [Geopyxis carbonaria]|nr:hypothetical protein EDC01DRAFT_634144 [Geopyxis carbonaria]
MPSFVLPPNLRHQILAFAMECGLPATEGIVLVSGNQTNFFSLDEQSSNDNLLRAAVSVAVPQPKAERSKAPRGVMSPVATPSRPRRRGLAPAGPTTPTPAEEPLKVQDLRSIGTGLKKLPVRAKRAVTATVPPAGGVGAAPRRINSTLGELMQGPSVSRKRAAPDETEAEPVPTKKLKKVPKVKEATNTRATRSSTTNATQGTKDKPAWRF